MTDGNPTGEVRPCSTENRATRPKRGAPAARNRRSAQPQGSSRPLPPCLPRWDGAQSAFRSRQPGNPGSYHVTLATLAAFVKPELYEQLEAKDIAG